MHVIKPSVVMYQSEVVCRGQKFGCFVMAALGFASSDAAVLQEEQDINNVLAGYPFYDEAAFKVPKGKAVVRIFMPAGTEGKTPDAITMNQKRYPLRKVLHPQGESYEAQVPSVTLQYELTLLDKTYHPMVYQPRLFARSAGKTDEVPLYHVAWHIYPEDDLSVCYAQGQCATQRYNAGDIRQVLVALDDSGAPREAAYFEQALLDRIGKDRAVHLARESVLLPEDAAYDDMMDELAALDEIHADAQDTLGAHIKTQHRVRRKTQFLQPATQDVLQASDGSTPPKCDQNAAATARKHVQENIAQHRPITGLDCSGLNLSSIRFSELDCSGCDFSYCTLNDACFDGCNLQGASFAGAMGDNTHFEGVHAQGANFTRSSFTQAHFQQVDFSRAQLSNTHWQACDIRFSSFEDQLISNADWQDVQLDGSTFSDITFFESTFERVSLAGAKCHDFTWQDGAWRHVKAQYLSAENFHFYDAIWCHVDARFADITKASLLGNEMRVWYADLSEGTWQALQCMGARLSHVVCQGSQLPKLQAGNTIWRYCTVMQCGLAEAHLGDAILIKSLWRHNFMRQAICTGIRLRATQFSHHYLGGAQWAYYGFDAKSLLAHNDTTAAYLKEHPHG
jgi:uncharacterized protein YjbI with pentapeptide repeats